ncbi:MAG: GNAT family N-acetyltransferase [Veillonellaceae bacterium]|nr:GNAT family N-acetyltransferase [Veillonellaceae bacterium]
MVHTQVGFARVISDLAFFAYQSDVFVLREHRGQGLGKLLINDPADIRKFMIRVRVPATPSV